MKLHRQMKPVVQYLTDNFITKPQINVSKSNIVVALKWDLLLNRNVKYVNVAKRYKEENNGRTTRCRM